MILASDLSFSQHKDSVCSKARKILGLLYRRFYNNASKDTLLQFYLSLVRLHLEYASPVWNPYMLKHIKQLKDVEKFALPMATKSWDSGYQDLLALTDIIALEPRRAQASLCMLFKIVHGLCFFPLQCDNHMAKSQSAYKQAITAPIQLLLIHAFQKVVAPCTRPP